MKQTITIHSRIPRRKYSKYHAQKDEVNGHKFDSKMEANYYRELTILRNSATPKERVIHIDLKPIVTLADCIRWQLDFFVYYADGRIEAVDVKGFETADFKVKRKLFDKHHPLAPLKVVKK